MFLDEHGHAAPGVNTEKWRQVRRCKRSLDGEPIVRQVRPRWSRRPGRAIAKAASGLVAFGYYTAVIVLFDEDRVALRELRPKRCAAWWSDPEGFGARIETLNATREAFLGNLPGNCC